MLTAGPRLIVRSLRLMTLLMIGLALVMAVRLDGGNRLDTQRLGQWWARRLLNVLDIQLQVQGRPHPGGHIIVANHVSWLDIFVLLASEPTCFVAKSEIRDWPVAGWLANALGTFYLRRGKGGVAPLVERLVPYLRQGGTVVIFPEGTTSDGQQVLPFHPRLFAAAVESSVTIQPVALRYGLTDDGRNIAPFVGDDDLLRHLGRLLAASSLQAELHYARVLPAEDNASREQLAAQAQRSIEKMLAIPETHRRARRAMVSQPSDAVTLPSK